METLRNPGVNFPVSGLAAIIVTGMLLLFVVSLSKINIPTQIIDRPEPVFIPYTEPPDPIETEATDILSPEPVAPIKRDPSTDTTPQVVPTLPIPPGNIDRLGDVNIPEFKPGIHVQVPRVSDIYLPEQVDQTPRILRPVIPMYPYQATVNGIEGRVVLRFIVDENGKVINPKVVKAEPEGVFEKAALAAIVKYKFIPAKVGGEKVKCSAVLPIGFKIN